MVDKCINPVVDPSVENILKDLKIDVDYLTEVINNAPVSATHYATDKDGDTFYYCVDENGERQLWIDEQMRWFPCSVMDPSRSLADAEAIIAIFKLQPSLSVKRFEMSSNTFRDSKPKFFTELNAPDWLTSVNTIKGSTMDGRWFWNDHVLKLEVGEFKDTDFQRITRIG